MDTVRNPKLTSCISHLPRSFFVSRDVQFIEEEAWDGSIEKTVDVKNCLSHDEDDEEMAEVHPQTVARTQGQQ